jgi:hypothetical protein
MRSEQFVSTNRGKPAIAATARSGEFKGKGVVPARAAGKAVEITPPAGNAATETKEKSPVTGQPAPTLPTNAPKPAEKPPAVENLSKPEAAPNVTKVSGKPPVVEKLAKPEPTPAKVEGKRPAIEKPVRPESQNAAQRLLERPPAQPERRPVQPERKPEAKECRRPGLPPCPKNRFRPRSESSQKCPLNVDSRRRPHVSNAQIAVILRRLGELGRIDEAKAPQNRRRVRA